MKARWSHCNDIRSALIEIMNEGGNTEITVKKYTSSPHKGSKDRRFIAEAIFDIVKNYRFYDYIKPERGDSFIAIITAYFYQNQILPPDNPEWQIIDPASIDQKIQEANLQPEVKYSVPQWLFEKGSQSLPNHWLGIIASSITKAPIYLRVNNTISDCNQLSRYFSKLGIGHTIVNENCIRLHNRINLNQDRAYQNGWYEIQDKGSQRIGHFCNPHIGMSIIDACCGGGGKSLHLADLMENSGHILALDINVNALKSFKNRLQRTPFTNISIADYNDAHKIESLNNSAEMVLCDVPCSATGVMRREIDQKWKLTPEQLNRLMDTQSSILSMSSHWVIPGGYLIYATCSVLPDENQNQIENFLRSHSEFLKIDEDQLYPETDGHDGFYMCKMQRNEF